MSTSIDSDVFMSNDEEYEAKLRGNGRKRYQNVNNNQGSGSDSDASSTTTTGDGSKRKKKRDKKLHQINTIDNPTGTSGQATGGLDPSLLNLVPVSEGTGKDATEEQLEEIQRLVQGLDVPIDIDSGLPLLTFEAIMSHYSHEGYKPNLVGIMQHKLRDYMIKLLINQEMTVYILKDNLSEARDKEYYVCPAVMVQLILENRVKNTDGEIIRPSSYPEVRRAREQIKALAWNQSLQRFSELYPYWPMGVKLPKLDIPVKLFDVNKSFRPDPALPSEDNVDKFIHAPCNTRYNGETYAANCRHHLTHWDEHPWCTWCILQANLPDCNETECYLCQRMSKTALAARRVARKKWRGKIAGGRAKERQDGKLAMHIRHQLHADLVTTRLDDNELWGEGRVGFCRPSRVVPMASTAKELTVFNSKQWESEVERQRDSWLVEYKQYRQRLMNRAKKQEDKEKVEVIWPGLDTIVTTVVNKRSKSDDDKGASGSKPPNRKKGGKGQNEKPPPPPPSPPVLELDMEDPSTEGEEEEEDKGQNETITPVTRVEWKGTRWSSDAPRSKALPMFNFTKAILGAGKLGSVRPIRVTCESEPDEDDPMLGYQEEREENVRFTKTNGRIVNNINEMLQSYKEDAGDPDLPDTLPVNMMTYPDSAIRARIQRPVSDKNDRLPNEEAVVEVNHYEMSHIEQYHRSLIKVEETDTVLKGALANYMKKLKEQIEAGDVTEIKKSFEECDVQKIVQGVCHNAYVREKLLGRVTGISLAIRRRDNAVKTEMSNEEICDAVAKPLSAKESEPEEYSLLA